MKLLVKRDTNILLPCDGKADLEEGVSKIFSVPRVVPQNEVTLIKTRPDNDDLLLANPEDYSEMSSHLSETGSYSSFMNKIFGVPIMNGIWSGHRSAVVQDPDTSKLFKLKGVALNPYNPETVTFDDGVFWISGGQKKKNVGYERTMSERFNGILGENGITPVMEYRGSWTYPVLVKGNRPAASIYEIQGDTRLDELMAFLDTLASDHIRFGDNTDTEEGEIFFRDTGRFYQDIGHVVGRLKKLMDASGQTWSCDSERTNAHIGNVVLWRDALKLKIGLVDFDASLDYSHTISKSEMESIQKKEHEDIVKSARGIQSLRTIGWTSNRLEAYTDLRDQFIAGFRNGYSSLEKTLSHEIDMSRLDELFSALRSGKPFSTTLVEKSLHGKRILGYYKIKNNKSKRNIDIESMLYGIYKSNIKSGKKV